MLQELNFGAYLGLPAFLLPLNQEDNTNLARVLTNHIHTGHHSSMVWLRASLSTVCYDSQSVLGILLFLAIQQRVHLAELKCQYCLPPSKSGKQMVIKHIECIFISRNFIVAIKDKADIYLRMYTR